MSLSDKKGKRRPLLDGLSTSSKQDDIISELQGIKSNQTDGDQITRIEVNNAEVGVQNPLPTDGDSVYSKDIDVSGSSVGTFTGDITDLVDDLDTTFSSTGHSSPANFTIKLKRPITNDSIKFCSPVGKNFSNVKITLKDASGATVRTIDSSSDDTKRTSFSYYWRMATWCTMVVEFYTTDDIDLNWAVIEKGILVHTPSKFRSLANSSSTPLAGGATFTGAWIDAKDYSGALIIINTDQDSAASGLVLEFSNDGGTTVIHKHIEQIYANSPNGHHYPTSIDTDYFRVSYTNGTSAQGIFYLSTTLFPVMPEPGHTHGVEYVIDADHPAAVVRNVNVARKPNGDYTNIEATAGGNLKVAQEEVEQVVIDSFATIDLRTNIEGGGYVTVGTTAVELTFTGTTNAIHIESKITNTGTIWIGKSDVDNAGANSIASIQPGESLDIRYDDSTNALYAVSDTAAQSVLKGAVL